MQRLKRASGTFDDADVVHGEARNRLLGRLRLFGLTPRRVLDLGAATGKASVELAALYPEAQVVALDLSRDMVVRAWERCAPLERAAAVVGDAEQLPFADQSVDLIFANLLLPWCDPRAVFGESARALRDGGLLLFTSVGPDTLGEVRRAWSRVDDTVHVHGFTDMHDLGDLATRAGLAEPVMDVDRLQVTYRTLGGLVNDLRACGATNVAHGRRPQFTGRERWQAFAEQLEEGREKGRLSISVELIFGQAWGVGASRVARDGTVGISVADVTRNLRDRNTSTGGNGTS